MEFFQYLYINFHWGYKIEDCWNKTIKNMFLCDLYFYKNMNRCRMVKTIKTVFTNSKVVLTQNKYISLDLKSSLYFYTKYRSLAIF